MSKTKRVLMERRDGGSPQWYIADCPTLWTAVTRRQIKGYNNNVIPRGEVLHGFDGSSRADVESHIADRVADGDWPEGSLKAISVVDCRSGSQRFR